MELFTKKKQVVMEDNKSCMVSVELTQTGSKLENMAVSTRPHTEEAKIDLREPNSDTHIGGVRLCLGSTSPHGKNGGKHCLKIRARCSANFWKLQKNLMKFIKIQLNHV
jgi:hypothetical protein